MVIYRSVAILCAGTRGDSNDKPRQAVCIEGKVLLWKATGKCNCMQQISLPPLAIFSSFALDFKLTKNRVVERTVNVA